MNIGIDIHGVIDRYPSLFSTLTRNLMEAKHEVFIITGQEWEKAESMVKALRISYTGHFSTVDHHLALGTKMWKDHKDTWWMHNDIWVRAKGEFIRSANIEVHFDDSIEYAKYIPENCTFVLVPKIGFEKYIRVMSMDVFGEQMT